MNETQDAPRTQDREQSQQPEGGPRVSAEQMRDVGRLRRSRSDRYVAGVAGGLGRHFDIDPTVVRVVLAVLTFFGGAGLLVYVAVWLLVPEDGEASAPLSVGSELQKVLLVGTAVVAALVVFGTPFANHGWGWGIPVPLLVIGLIALWAYSFLRRDKRPAPPPAPWTTAATTPARPPVTAGEQSPPAWMPPPTPAYVGPPPKPRRTGLVLFWPTLALVAISLGSLGIYDVDHDVFPSAYAALALAVVALMLLVGAFAGRPGGLIALGLIGTLALAGTTTIEAATNWNTGSETAHYAPTRSVGVQDIYSVPNGELGLDLRGITDPAALDGRTIDLHLNAGEIEVEVPPGVNTVVNSKLTFAGDLEVGGSERSGLTPELNRTLASTTTPETAPTLTLDIQGRVGHVTVQRN